MVLMNVAIAILNEGYSDCVDEMQTEERRLAITTGRSAKVSLFESIWIRARTGAAKKAPKDVVPSGGGGGLKGFIKGKKDEDSPGTGRSGGLQTVYDKCADTVAMRGFVKKVDLKQIETVRQHVIKGSKMGIRELTPVFGGNLDAARKFCMHAWAVQKDIARQPHTEEEKSLEIEMLDDVKRSLDKVLVTIDRITQRMEAEQNPYEAYTAKRLAEERKRAREQAALDVESGVLLRTAR